MAMAAVAAAGHDGLRRQGAAGQGLVLPGGRQADPASGAELGTFSTVLQSDVLTKGSVLEDLGQVTLHIAMKDVTALTEPTENNVITVNRYHVDYVRADGRNTQGVDVHTATTARYRDDRRPRRRR